MLSICTLRSAESLRVFYVATTRAEERLVISTPLLGVNKNGKPKGVSGSRFRGSI